MFGNPSRVFVPRTCIHFPVPTYVALPLQQIVKCQAFPDGYIELKIYANISSKVKMNVNKDITLNNSQNCLLLQPCCYKYCLYPPKSLFPSSFSFEILCNSLFMKFYPFIKDQLKSSPFISSFLVMPTFPENPIACLLSFNIYCPFLLF